MRLVRLRSPGGLENLKFAEEDCSKPRRGELLVRIRACALNFLDDLLVLGKKTCTDGRIPLSDGVGEVIAIGDDVNEFKVADNVVSTFYPYWLGGEMTPATRWDVLGESIDGYAREYVCMPAHFFTKAPAGYADGTQVKVFADYITHTPKGRLDLYVVGEEKPGRVVASAAGRSMPQQLRVDRASQRRVDEL